MSLYRKSTQADPQDGGVKRNRESLRQQDQHSTQSSTQSSSTQTQAQQSNTQIRTNNNKSLPPLPQSRFHVYDESDGDSSGHEYGMFPVFFSLIMSLSEPSSDFFEFCPSITLSHPLFISPTNFPTTD